MGNILKHFKTIASIPHCSFDTKLLQEEIVRFAKEIGCVVSVDKAGNVLCKKGEPKICLQSHYDMVCIGDAPKVELLQIDNILKAKNSTLGADNGMGMAIMFSMLEKYSDIECLFTNDEEVGLIGANNLELELSADKLLNLDGEQEDEIYVGCAGGVDIISTYKLKKRALESGYTIYKASVENLAGGHSGVDIDKGIQSAIKVLASELVKHDVKLLHIEGGEMRNSIPKNAHAYIASKSELKSNSNLVTISKSDFEKKEYFENSDTILHVIHAFSQGVREFYKEYMIPKTSINMGKIIQEKDVLRIDCSARSLVDKDLDILADETCSLFALAGFESKKTDAYPSWNPDIKEFSLLVKDIMSQTYPQIQLKAIHAGLECGILIQKQEKSIEAVSIGPTIRFPHSLREECDLDSVERIKNAVEEIIKRVGE